MAARTGTNERIPLSRERVLQCALALADRDGIAGLTIRTLAQELGSRPMSLYYYVANKEQILDGIVDLVFGEVHLPVIGNAWREEMLVRARSMREVLSRHPWAVGLLESRTHPGPATLRHHDATLGTLRSAGFTLRATAHAYALLDSYIYGFALQEVALPLSGAESVADVAAPIMEQFAGGQYPWMMEIATGIVMQPGYDFGDEFEYGLELILDGLHPH
ncbi:TetR/AcrR family transcriptional regulator C-terminal domain-containing protein [Arthrobacter sedimenti]|uniref:TetR/AcrR family transcriptional regulator C-terminal domain-containing protein n=1 Tax=Arthrobacter sedimenti TaxID=2694931 RepID=UPI000B353382|nr:TetR/AcrR family transcriptional regulator C-terminal domain-containing protein [Arthrobacter sedimenti]OUM39482.1 TetR family transcriptional regulator [Arthrobacter agilis]